MERLSDLRLLTEQLFWVLEDNDLSHFFFQNRQDQKTNSYQKALKWSTVVIGAILNIRKLSKDTEVFELMR